MKREQFDLDVVSPSADSPDCPTLAITYDGSIASLLDRLSTPADGGVGPDDVDVAFRLLDEQRGVLSVADRFTGRFLCELDAAADRVTDVVAAAEETDGRYRIELAGTDDTWAVEKRTLLVYDADGHLLRTCSLIPGSVEL